jgi:hypothetical protein
LCRVMDSITHGCDVVRFLTSEERKRNVDGGVLADCPVLWNRRSKRLRRYYVSEAHMDSGNAILMCALR